MYRHRVGMCCAFKSGDSSCSLIHPPFCSMTLSIAFTERDTNQLTLQVQSRTILLFYGCVCICFECLGLWSLVSTKQGSVSHLSSWRCASTSRFSLKGGWNRNVSCHSFVQLNDNVKSNKKRSLALVRELIPAFWNIINLISNKFKLLKLKLFMLRFMAKGNVSASTFSLLLYQS